MPTLTYKSRTMKALDAISDNRPTPRKVPQAEEDVRSALNKSPDSSVDRLCLRADEADDENLIAALKAARVLLRYHRACLAMSLYLYFGGNYEERWLADNRANYRKWRTLVQHCEAERNYRINKYTSALSALRKAR